MSLFSVHYHSSSRPLRKTNSQLIRCLLTNGPETTIIEASKNGHEDIVKVLIEKGVDIDTKDDYGCTSLYYAALKGHAELVDLLIENGAEIDIRSNCGGTALVQAVFFGHTDIAKTLIDNGANINVTIHGDTLVNFATKNGYEDLLDHLIYYGASYDNIKTHNDSCKSHSRFKKWRIKLRNGELRN